VDQPGAWPLVLSRLKTLLEVTGTTADLAWTTTGMSPAT
jgi:hypothetical protein